MPSIVNSNPLSLENIGRGDTIQRFNEAMKECLLNVKDPNTNLKPRKIIIEVIVTPGPDRDTADFDVHVKKTFRPVLPYKSSIYIGHNIYGELEAHEAIEVSEETEGAPEEHQDNSEICADDRNPEASDEGDDSLLEDL